MKILVKHTLAILIGICCTIGAVQAQDLSLYQKHWLIQGNDTLPFRLLLPDGYDTSKTYPLLVFLHGAGERGRDNEKQLTHGASLFVQDSMRKQFPAIVVFPQCPLSSYWSNVVQLRHDSLRTFHFLPGGEPTKAMTLLQQLLPLLLQQYKVNKHQVYAGGLSMGGMGTFELVRRNPGLFAAAFPICGGASPATAARLKNVSWWVFHGAKDDVVPAVHSQVMVAALQKEKVPVKFTLYPDVNHNSWDNAFAEKELLPWLFSQRTK